MQDEYISKSQRKRECDALQKLGDTLIQLSQHDLQLIDLPDNLSRAIHEARRITSRSGQKRQRQYVGKLIRDIDSEVVKTQLNKIQQRHNSNNARFHQLEQWRDDLITGTSNTLQEIIATYPHIDRQHFRQMIKRAQKEHEADAETRICARKLFRYLRKLDDASNP